jgi:hypothetical protein
MIRVRTVFTGVAGTPWYSNLYFDGAGLTSVDAQTALNNVRALWNDYKGSMSSQISINLDPFVPVINPATGDVTGGFTVTPGATIIGSGVGERMPSLCQVLVSLKTGSYVGGRQVAGKCFLPGTTEALNTANGDIPSASAAYFAGLFNTLVAAAGPDPVVWSKKAGAVYQIASATASTKWAVLRSRRD